MNGRPAILLVDDESAVRLGLSLVLKQAGYMVGEAGDGLQAVESVKTTMPDLIILDVEMPRMDGWQTIAALRRMEVGCPILMFTQLADTPARVRGLDTGADDYVCKPCTPEELLARVRALLRRTGKVKQPESTLRFGDVVVDLEHRTATKAGQPLRLSPTDYVLLRLLVATPGVPVSREAIAENVWDGGAGSSHALDTHLWRLRKKLGDDATAPRWLKNVPGFGYVLSQP